MNLTLPGSLYTTVWGRGVKITTRLCRPAGRHCCSIRPADITLSSRHDIPTPYRCIPYTRNTCQKWFLDCSVMEQNMNDWRAARTQQPRDEIISTVYLLSRHIHPSIPLRPACLVVGGNWLGCFFVSSIFV